jgi:energy-coupling factor transporter transmembrane protein EcfT
VSDYFNIEMGVKGNVQWIDPKSKLLTTLVIVIGLSLSLYSYQITFFAAFILPLVILYRPNKRVIYRILFMMPFSILISTFLYLGIKEDIRVNLLLFHREYSPEEFIIFNLYRFIVSMIHSSILIESEDEATNLIDALASFRVFQYVVSILLLIHRLITRLQFDFKQMLDSAKSKGYLHQSTLPRFFFKLRLMSKLLTKATIYGETIGYTLSARGFNQEGYTSITRNWTSEGLTVLYIVLVISLFSLSLPFWDL